MSIYYQLNHISRSSIGKICSVPPSIINSISHSNKGQPSLIPKNTYILSRSATISSIDDTVNTYNDIRYNDFEYRFIDSPINFRGCKITLSINKGEGWISNALFDFYYIPHGIVNPSGYVKFGTYDYLGGIDYTHLDVLKEVSDFVKADGVYLIHSLGAIEAGSAYLEEVACYELV